MENFEKNFLIVAIFPEKGLNLGAVLKTLKDEGNFLITIKCVLIQSISINVR